MTSMPATGTVRLAIIGTAGRGPDGRRLAENAGRFLARMKDASIAVAERVGATTLVSGGAAFADHVAVMLFLEQPGRFNLQLHLPSELTPCADGLQFVDTGVVDFAVNPGGTCNHYHRLFHKALRAARPGWSPFADFSRLRADPAVSIVVTPGMHARNRKVACGSDIALAMTFGEGRRVKDGGTHKTMRDFLASHTPDASYHLDLV